MKTLDFEKADLRGQQGKALNVLIESEEKKVKKISLRQSIETELEKFLKRGGRITEVPSPPPVPRQPAKNIELYPSRSNKNPYHGNKANAELREWCSKRVGRQAVLANATGYSRTWISARTHGAQILSLVDYAQLKSLMLEIEQAEKMAEIMEKHGVKK